jgi:hypothetical protein
VKQPLQAAKIKRYWPFGPHSAHSSLLTNIGAIWEDLNSRGIPCYHKAVDHYGPIFELMNIGDKHGVENVCVFRMATHKSGWNPDVPNWYTTPKLAAEYHVAQTLKYIPPEFDRRCWLELINETDKDDDDRYPDWGTIAFTNWLAEFMIECAKILLPMGYKVLGFGYSSGEPEQPGDKSPASDWEAEKMLEFLRLCEENHESLGVALHEYSFQPGTFLGSSPWLVGRFLHLFEICDKYKIKRPLVSITEFGESLWSLPSANSGVPELVQLANEFYALNPEILGVALWNFGGDWDGIQKVAVQYLAPMHEIAKTYMLEVEVGEPPIDPPPKDVRFDQWWEMSVQEQTEHGIQLAETGLQNAIRADGFHPVHKEAYWDAQPPMMGAEDWNNRTDPKPRRVYIWWEGKAVWFRDPAIYDPPDLGDPPPPPPPPNVGIDLEPYFMPVGEFGPLFELRRSNGSQERVQHQKSGNKLWITKGTGGKDGKSEFEELLILDTWVYRGLDTSPGDGRFYVQYDEGNNYAKWCKRFMKVGETFWGSGHRVQFFHKSNCQPSSPNSGNSTNIITLAAKHDQLEFNSIQVYDVIELHGSNGEKWFFANGIGMVAWESPWNSSSIAELHLPGQRPNNQMESVCNYVLP